MTSQIEIPEGAIVLGVGLDPGEATDFYARVNGNERVEHATVLTRSDGISASVGELIKGVYFPERAPVMVIVGAQASAETVDEVLGRISGQVKVLRNAL